MDLIKHQEGIEKEMISMLEDMEGISECEMKYEEAQKCYLNHIEAEKRLEELAFTKQMNQLKLESEQKRIKDESSVVKKAWGVTKDVLDIGIKVAGVVLVPIYVVTKAYDGDKDMKLVNGRIWNMLGRKFDR